MVKFHSLFDGGRLVRKTNLFLDFVRKYLVFLQKTRLALFNC